MTIDNGPIPPLNFELSGAEALVLSGRKNGVGPLLNAATKGCRQGGLDNYMHNVANFIFPSPGEGLEDLMITDYFVQAPNLIYLAFIQSGLPERPATSILGQIRNLRLIPYDIATADETKRMSLVIEQGKESITKHPEASGLIGLTNQYATEIYQDQQIGSAAVAGMCFALSRLDAGWDAAREAAIEGEQQRALEQVDWAIPDTW